jgi:DNA repair protein RecN (Recombination protein N)
MLIYLKVQNFALVDQLELEFESGMSVISGETGAGKSIILDALGLCLGDRADTGFIGSKADKAEIHATFELGDPPNKSSKKSPNENKQAIAWLTERELLTNDAECILRRVISKDGRSRAFINGAPSTVADVKALGEMLIDIHSQHEHQSLLKKDTHRRLLDEYGDLSKTALEVTKHYQDHHETFKKLEQITSESEERAAQFQLLSYQVRELDELAIEIGEHTTLEQEQKQLTGAEGILTNCHTAVELCSGGNPGNNENIRDQLAQAITLLNRIDVPALQPIIELFNSGQIQLDEAIADLERFTETFEADPHRLQIVEERLSAIYETARKHRIQPSDIADFHNRIAAELDSISHSEDDITTLTAKLAEHKATYDKKAAKLSKSRKKAAQKLETSVGKQLVKLGMTGASFKIELTPVGIAVPNARGHEEIEFLISTNPGQTPRSLNKIASGGELSRISLAIQVVTADTSRVPTLIFDEVDVGIGGAIAEVVGGLLRELGHKAQIVCVTHLPQVASQGHHHFLVAKAGTKTKVTTDIVALDQAARIEEIARMLGGIDLTKQSIAHAKEMFELAQARVSLQP